jgi:hypothetical protein
MGDANNGNIKNIWMGAQEIFQFSRRNLKECKCHHTCNTAIFDPIYLKSLDFDQLLDPVYNEEPLLLVVHGNVASVEPSVFVNYFGRGLGVVQVAFHDLHGGKHIFCAFCNVITLHMSYEAADCLYMGTFAKLHAFRSAHPLNQTPPSIQRPSCIHNKNVNAWCFLVTTIDVISYLGSPDY